MKIQQGLSATDFTEELLQHSCDDCGGEAVTMEYTEDRGIRETNCPHCVKGFVTEK